MAKEKSEKETNEDKVILLAKAFEGSWNDKEGNTAHEIINFFKADNNKYYIYFSPYGNCNKDVYINKNGDIEKDCKEAKRAKYQAQYLIMTSPAEINSEKSGEEDWKSRFKIKYVIKLEQRLQFLSASTKNAKNKSQDTGYQNLVSKITYGNKKLTEIFPTNNRFTPLVTFEAEWIKEPQKPIEVETEEYNFQRHRGYVYEDKYGEDYEEIINNLQGIEEEQNSGWKKFKLKTIKDASKKYQCSEKNKTFLNLILKTDSEEIYTNILYHIFKHNDIFNQFLNYLKKLNVKVFCSNDKEYVLSNTGRNEFDIYREYSIIEEDNKGKNKEDKTIEKGRMDICADSKEFRVFIENKIASGLNNIKKNGGSQLSIYREWAKGKEKYLCLVLVPDYRKAEIEEEIKQYEGEEKCTFYNIITYLNIVDFVTKMYNKNEFTGFIYEKYISDIINIFKNHSYNDKLALYTNMFLDISN